MNDQVLEIKNQSKSNRTNFLIIFIITTIFGTLFWASRKLHFIGPDLWMCLLGVIIAGWILLEQILRPNVLAILKTGGFEFWVENKAILCIYRHYQVTWDDVTEIYTRKIVSPNETQILRALAKKYPQKIVNHPEPEIRTTVFAKVSKVPIKIKAFSISASNPNYFLFLDFLKKKVDPYKVQKETFELNRGNIHAFSKEEVEWKLFNNQTFKILLGWLFAFIVMMNIVRQSTTIHH